MPAPLSTAGRSSPSSPTTSSASYSAGTRSFRGFLACTEVDSRNLKTKRVWSRGQGTTRLPLGLLISGKEKGRHPSAPPHPPPEPAGRNQCKSLHNREAATKNASRALTGALGPLRCCSRGCRCGLVDVMGKTTANTSGRHTDWRRWPGPVKNGGGSEQLGDDHGLDGGAGQACKEDMLHRRIACAFAASSTAAAGSAVATGAWKRSECLCAVLNSP